MKPAKRKRALAFLLCLCMLSSYLALPGPLAARSGGGDTGLCPHHTEHDANCGYVEAVEGQPCAHIHDESCGFYASGGALPDADDTETNVRDEDVYSVEDDAQALIQDGIEEQGIDTDAHEDYPVNPEEPEAGVCTHEHDDSCGYEAPLEGQPCEFVCETCSYIVLDWVWKDEYEVLLPGADYGMDDVDWVLAAPGLDSDDLEALLPTEIIAVTKDGTASTLPISWDLDNPREYKLSFWEWLTSLGEDRPQMLLYTARLPEEYTLDKDAPALTVLVQGEDARDAQIELMAEDPETSDSTERWDHALHFAIRHWHAEWDSSSKYTDKETAKSGDRYFVVAEGYIVPQGELNAHGTYDSFKFYVADQTTNEKGEKEKTELVPGTHDRAASGKKSSYIAEGGLNPTKGSIELTPSIAKGESGEELETFSIFTISAGRDAVTYAYTAENPAPGHERNITVQWRDDVHLVKGHAFYTSGTELVVGTNDSKVFGDDDAAISSSLEQDTTYVYVYIQKYEDHEVGDIVKDDKDNPYTEEAALLKDHPELKDYVRLTKVYNTAEGLHTDKTVTAAGEDGRTFDLDLEAWYTEGYAPWVGMVLDASGSMAFASDIPEPINVYEKLGEEAAKELLGDKIGFAKNNGSFSMTGTEPFPQYDNLLGYYEFQSNPKATNAGGNNADRVGDYRTWLFNSKKDERKNYTTKEMYDNNRDNFASVVKQAVWGGDIDFSDSEHVILPTDFQRLFGKNTWGTVPANFLDGSGYNLAGANASGLLLDVQPKDAQNFTISFNLLQVDNGPCEKPIEILYIGAEKGSADSDYFHVIRRGNDIVATVGSTPVATISNAFTGKETHTISFVFNENSVTTYVDGVLQGKAVTIPTLSGTTVVFAPFEDENKENPYFFLDSVYLFDTALKAGEIKTLCSVAGELLIDTVTVTTEAFLTPAEQALLLDPRNTDDSMLGTAGYNYFIYNPTNTLAEYVPLGYYTKGTTKFGKMDFDAGNGWYYASYTNWGVYNEKGTAKVLYGVPASAVVNDTIKAGISSLTEEENGIGTAPDLGTDFNLGNTGIQFEFPSTAGLLRFYIDSRGYLRCFYASGANKTQTFVSYVYELDDWEYVKTEALQRAVGDFATRLSERSRQAMFSAVKFSGPSSYGITSKHLLLKNWTNDAAQSANILDPQKRTDNGETIYALTGGTNTDTGLQAFIDLLAPDAVKDAEEERYLILFTDGRTDSDQTKTKNLADELKGMDFTIFTVLLSGGPVKEGGKDYQDAHDFLVDLSGTPEMLWRNSSEAEREPYFFSVDKAKQELGAAAKGMSDSDVLTQIFSDKILSKIVKPLNSYTIQDYIDPRFDLVAGLGVKHVEEFEADNDQPGIALDAVSTATTYAYSEDKDYVIHLNKDGNVSVEDETTGTVIGTFDLVNGTTDMEDSVVAGIIPKTDFNNDGVKDSAGVEDLFKPVNWGAKEHYLILHLANASTTDIRYACLYYDQAAEMYYLKWLDQTIPACAIGEKELFVWKAQITIRAKEDFIGGNAVLTNGNAKLQNYVYNNEADVKSSGTGESIKKNEDDLYISKGFPRVAVNVSIPIDKANESVLLYMGEEVGTDAVQNIIQAMKDAYMDSSMYYYWEYLERYMAYYNAASDEERSSLEPPMNGEKQISPREDGKLHLEDLYEAIVGDGLKVPYHYLPDSADSNQTGGKEHRADRMGYLTYVVRSVTDSGGKKPDGATGKVEEGEVALDVVFSPEDMETRKKSNGKLVTEKDENDEPVYNWSDDSKPAEGEVMTKPKDVYEDPQNWKTVSGWIVLQMKISHKTLLDIRQAVWEGKITGDSIDIGILVNLTRNYSGGNDNENVKNVPIGTFSKQYKIDITSVSKTRTAGISATSEPGTPTLNELINKNEDVYVSIPIQITGNNADEEGLKLGTYTLDLAPVSLNNDVKQLFKVGAIAPIEFDDTMMAQLTEWFGEAPDPVPGSGTPGDFQARADKNQAFLGEHADGGASYTSSRFAAFELELEPIVPGDLIVSKTVVHTKNRKDVLDEADKAQEFHFKVKLSNTALSGKFGDMDFENGVATFTLKHGQSVTASLPTDMGLTYTVTELDANQYGYTTTSTNETGTITNTAASIASFTNSKDDSNGALKVSKTVTGTGNKTMPFHFTVTLGGEGASEVNGTYGDMTFTMGVAKFDLTHNQSKTATGLPAGLTYEVVEDEVEDYTVIKSDNNTSAEIKDGETVEVNFRNHSPKFEALEIDISKLVTWPDGTDQPADKLFTFTLKADSKNPAGAILPDKTEVTITGARVGNFDPITFTQPGTYTFIVQEKKGSDKGYIYDTKEHKITVVVENNTDINPEIKSITIDGKVVNNPDRNKITLVIVNDYHPESVDLPISVTKTVDAPDGHAETVSAARFTFKLEKVTVGAGVTMPDPAMVTIEGEGTKSFAPITFTQAGIYTFTVEEIEGDAAGFTYDTQKRTVTVKVEDNAGALKVTKVSVGENVYEGDTLASATVSITNTYAPEIIIPDPTVDPITVNLEAQKTYKDELGNKKTLAGGDFKFTLTGEKVEHNDLFSRLCSFVGNLLGLRGAEDEKAPMPTKTTVYNSADGTITFGPIEFSGTGVYTYTIAEVADENRTDIRYDERVYTAVVTVTKKDDGKLNAEVTYYEGTDTSKPSVELPTFINTHKTGDLTITKAVKGNAPGAGTKEYTFTITGPADVAGRTYNLADGKTVTFGANRKTQVTITGEDSVTIKNLPAGKYAVAENKDEVAIKDYGLVVTGEGDATVPGDGSVAVTVTNTYARLPYLVITKVVTGNAPGASTKQYAFTVTGPADVTGKTYDLVDGKTVTFDANREAQVTITGAGSAIIEGLPAGTYTVAENKEGAAITDYDLVVTGEGDAAVPDGGSATVTVTNTYAKIPYLTITKAIEGNAPGADTKPYAFTVTGPADVAGETYTLLDGKTVAFDANRKAQVAITGAGSVTIEGLPAGTYTVAEDKEGAAITGYDLVVTGEADATVPDGGIATVTVTNTYTKTQSQTPSRPSTRPTTSVTVQKVWDDNDSADRPKDVSVQLYRGTDAYGDPVTLHEDNNWRYTWSDLRSGYTWTVNEVDVPEGYESSVTHTGDIWTITNSRNNSGADTTPAPGTTPDPEATPTPGTTPDPEATPTPGTTPDPETTPTPGTTSEVEITPAPGTTPEPGNSSEVSSRPDDVPQTGDDSHLGLWLTLMILSAMGMLGIGFFSGKKKYLFSFKGRHMKK